MSSELIVKPPFNYDLVSEEQEMALKEIAIKLQVRVQRTAEEMLAMGADLRDAKTVCKEEGKLFGAWCESAECPVGYKTAQRLIAVRCEIGGGKDSVSFFGDAGYAVLATVTQTRDEDMRAALLEHVEKEAGEGHKISQKEISALKKALSEEQKRIDELEDETFSAKQALADIKRERDEAQEKKEQFAKDLIAGDRQRRELEALIADKQHEMEDADEVHREHLQEMRKRISEEERNRPRTSQEEADHEARLKELKDAEQVALGMKNEADKQRKNAEKELKETQKELKFREKVLSDFATAAIKFRQDALLLQGTASTLAKIPITDALYDQIHTVIELAQDTADKLQEALSVG